MTEVGKMRIWRGESGLSSLQCIVFLVTGQIGGGESEDLRGRRVEGVEGGPA